MLTKKNKRLNSKEKKRQQKKGIALQELGQIASVNSRYYHTNITQHSIVLLPPQVKKAYTYSI